MTHSIEIRRRAVDAYTSGAGSYESLGRLMQIGSATLKRWVRKQRETGSLEAQPHTGGREVMIQDGELDWLHEQLEIRNDLTLGELCAQYCRKFHEVLSIATIGRAVRERLKWTRKKRPSGQSSVTRRARSRCARNTKKK